MSDVPMYCPSWEYQDVPGHEAVLSARTLHAIKSMRVAARADKLAVCLDTRRFHSAYFDALTPDGYDYYAGNYRGSRFSCLLFRNVRIASDPKVGHPAGTIHFEMFSFARSVKSAVFEMDQVQSASSYLLSPEEKLLRTIDLVAALFVYYLEIHPYLNGNGHMARLILLCLLGVYGIYPERWSIDPRPQDPPYSTAIFDYRRGNDKPLVHFILSCL